MTNRSQGIARGAVWLLASQVVIGGGQFLYAGITARVFTPTQFGEFAASLGLVGLLTVVTTTALPSFVLKEKVLTRSDVVRARLFCISGSAGAAIAFVLLSPTWLFALNATGGAVFTPLLTAAQFLTPVAALESALRRREGRSALDAAALLGAFIGSAGLGVAAVMLLQAPWTLAVATVASPAFLFLLSRPWSKSKFDDGRPAPIRAFLIFGWRITLQNSAFVLLSQIPSWVVSLTLGAAHLGQFSRANTLTALPANTISTATNRALQPHWRHVHGARELRLATNEAGILAAGFGFPIFAILAGTGTGVTELWLGPGWDAAGVLVVILAPVAALQVVFNVLANSSEMQGHFLPVRTAQFWLAAGLLPGLGLLVATRDLRWAGAALLISQSASLVVLCLKLNSQDAILRNRFLIDISLQLGIAILIGFGSFGASVMVESTSLTVAGSAAIASVFAGGIAGLIVLAVTIRLNPAPSILYRRGISVPSMLLPRRRREKRQRAAE